MSIQGLENVDYFFKILRQPTPVWSCLSNITVASVGILSKIILSCLNTTSCHNLEEFNKIVENRPKGVPLVTLSNHTSCVDDPAIWGCLRWRQLLSGYKMRWSLAAHDVCYTKKRHSYFFALGKSIPAVRGGGVYQNCIEFCIEKLKKGEWVHVFPEGKINMTKEFVRIKWGIGRLIYESPVTPIVIPIWHIGMDELLPTIEPYVLQLKKKIFFNFGEPINLTEVVKELRTLQVTPEQAMKTITDLIQLELLQLKIKTEELYKSSVSSSNKILPGFIKIKSLNVGHLEAH